MCRHAALPEVRKSITIREADSVVFPQPSQKPGLSIIIPVYNKWKYTLNCLKSMCEKTDGDYEAIVIDDASNDNTANITYCQGLRIFVWSGTEKTSGLYNPAIGGPRQAKENFFQEVFSQRIPKDRGGVFMSRFSLSCSKMIAISIGSL